MLFNFSPSKADNPNNYLSINLQIYTHTINIAQHNLTHILHIYKILNKISTQPIHKRKKIVSALSGVAEYHWTICRQICPIIALNSATWTSSNIKINWNLAQPFATSSQFSEKYFFSLFPGLQLHIININQINTNPANFPPFIECKVSDYQSAWGLITRG